MLTNEEDESKNVCDNCGDEMTLLESEEGGTTCEECVVLMCSDEQDYDDEDDYEDDDEDDDDDYEDYDDEDEDDEDEDDDMEMCDDCGHSLWTCNCTWAISDRLEPVLNG
jgi:hypothetical protein